MSDEQLPPTFDDTKGLPGRFFVVWLSTSALLMLIEAVFARNIIASLLTLAGLPFVNIANLYEKQGEFYDIRFGYQRADRNRIFLWFFPALLTVLSILCGLFVLALEIWRAHYHITTFHR